MYRITHDTRQFKTLEAAKKALKRAVYENRDSKRIMGHIVDTPNWGVYEEGKREEGYIFHAEELFE